MLMYVDGLMRVGGLGWTTAWNRDHFTGVDGVAGPICGGSPGALGWMRTTCGPETGVTEDAGGS